MNKVIFIGRITNAIELKKAQSGTEYVRFGLAVQQPFKNKQTDKYETDFFDCVVWRQPAGLLAKYCKKGDQIGLEGWLRQNTYADKTTGEKRTKYEVMVERFDFGAKAGNGNGNAQGPAHGNNAAAQQGQYGGGYDDPFDEEMPF